MIHITILILVVMILVLSFIEKKIESFRGYGRSSSRKWLSSLSSLDDNNHHPESIYSSRQAGYRYGMIGAQSVLNCSVCQACLDPKKACQSSCRQCCFRCGICRCSPRLRHLSKYINAPLYAEDEKEKKQGTMEEEEGDEEEKEEEKEDKSF